MNKKDKTVPGSSSSKKSSLPEQHEEFNTGSHSPDSLRNVGPGYDDTGMGNDQQTSKSRQKNTVRNSRTKKTRSRNRQY